MKRFLVAAVCLMLAGPVAGQEPWRTSYFPYVIGNPTDGVMLVARWQRVQNAPYFISKALEGDVINPLTFAGAVSVDAGIGTLGSRFGRAEFRAPGLADGWRFRAVVGAERTGRLAYYGVGGDLTRVPDGDDPNANIYRVKQARYVMQAEATRRLSGGLRAALGASLDRTNFSARDDSTVFRDDYGSGFGNTNLVVRPALVFDSRDREFTPSRGILAEAGAGFGTGGEAAAPTHDGGVYGFGYVQLKAYLSPREGTVLAMRGLISGMEDKAPLSARMMIPGWEREFALSGASGHRSFPAGALAGHSVRLLSVELRHDLLNFGDLGAVTLLGFSDYARVSDNGATFRTDTEQFGAGGGLAIRVLRSAVLNMGFAGGSHGFNFSMGTTWAF